MNSNSPPWVCPAKVKSMPNSAARSKVLGLWLRRMLTTSGITSGDSSITIASSGGVEIEPATQPVAVGDRSRGIKVTKVNLRGHTYSIDYDYLPTAVDTFELHTPWTIDHAEGARFEKISPGRYRVVIDPSVQNAGNVSYQHGDVQVTFAQAKLQ